jgi:hypothetical protein
MLDVTPVGWAATLAIIAGLLALDWYVLGRRPHVISLGEAARWSILYIAIALSFGVAFSLLNGWDLGGQYFAGYVVEKSLSVDNLFVFVLIIGSFAVPAAQQPKALSIGIAPGPRSPRGVHRRRRSAAGAVRGHVPGLRRCAARHSSPAVSPPQPRSSGRGQPNRQARAALPTHE